MTVDQKCRPLIRAGSHTRRLENGSAVTLVKLEDDQYFCPRKVDNSCAKGGPPCVPETPRIKVITTFKK